jgi:hypothetical protein
MGRPPGRSYCQAAARQRHRCAAVSAASLTAPQIAGERGVWTNSGRTDLRTPAENHPDGAIPNHLPVSDRCPVTAMTLKVSGREYTLGVGLRESLLNVPRDRLGLTGTGHAASWSRPGPVTSSSQRR